MNSYVEEKNVENHFANRYEIERVLYSKVSPFQKVEVVQTRGHGRMLLND
jgi:spermidine synthase